MRLLAVNLNYMGDALFTTPALASLRARFPDARIDVLAGERAAAILEGNPSVDGMILRPPHGGSGRAVALARTLRAGRYDAVILFQSTLTNAVLALTAGVPIRVGFAQEGCAPLLTKSVASRRSGEHDVDAYLRLVEALDSPAPTDDAQTCFSLKVSLSDEDLAFADRFFSTHELMPPVIGLVIGATRAQKRWPEEYFARLAEKLYDVAGISCVLLGGPEEREAADRILALARGANLISAIGQTTEKQLAALISRLGVVVSGDSGPLHIATAMATPVVALFGSTDPDDTGPWVRDQDDVSSRIILYDALSCAPCRKNPTCEGRFDCMRALTPERVYDAVFALLEEPAPRPKRVVLPVLPRVSQPQEHRPAAPPRISSNRPVRSVLVLTKHRFMGDTIVAVPLLRAVRQAYPKARIMLVTGRLAATALQNCPYGIEILEHDKNTGERTAAGSVRLSLSLARRMLDLLLHNPPDLCLVADRSFRAAVAARFCGGRVRAGFNTEGRGWLLTDPIPYETERAETECCLDILRAVSPELPGRPPYESRPALWTTEEERAKGRAILAAAGVLDPITFCGPIVGIQPGASLKDRKQWPCDRFAKVACQLVADGARIVLIGDGESELNAAREMRVAMGDTPVVDLTGKTRLRDTMGVLTHFALFVGNDTGITHIAAALGRPTVALFGPTPAHKWGNAGLQHRVIVADGSDMSTIDANDVLAAARDLLSFTEAADKEKELEVVPASSATLSGAGVTA